MNSPAVEPDASAEAPAEQAAYSYGNFRDPVGLAIRMLKSRKRQAWSALFREGLQIGLTPLDWLLSKFNGRRFGGKNSEQSVQVPQQPLLLVIGPPRGGTTLVYQTLVRYCDVSWVDNLNAIFPRSSLFALRLSRSWPKGRTAPRSFYGQTAGLHGPNEGFHIWDRWLGDDRYQVGQSLTNDAVQEMNWFFGQWTDATKKPFVNKNNRCTACMQQLAENLARVQFVVVQRDRRDVVRSLIRAREFVQGDKRIPWGLFSRRLHADRHPLGYVDDVCEQVNVIEQNIQQQLSQMNSKQVLTVRYEDFCAAPAKFLEDVLKFVPGLKLDEQLVERELRPFRASGNNRLTDAEEARMDACFAATVDVAEVEVPADS